MQLCRNIWQFTCRILLNFNRLCQRKTRISKAADSAKSADETVTRWHTGSECVCENHSRKLRCTLEVHLWRCTFLPFHKQKHSTKSHLTDTIFGFESINDHLFNDLSLLTFSEREREGYQLDRPISSIQNLDSKSKPKMCAKYKTKSESE